jgi:predicted transcriptional regulator
MKNELLGSSCEIQPSMIVLKRMMETLMQNSVGRTRLSQAANVHYNVLLKHLKWLEHRHYIEFRLEDHKARVRLTEDGREFARRVLSLYD